MAPTSRCEAHAVTVHGAEGPTVLLAHGLGGRPRDWQPVVESLQSSFRVITFAQAGSLDADPSLFSPSRHSTVLGFADDLGALCAELGLRQVLYVGHSLAACAGALASIGDPGLFSRLVLLNGSACYVDQPDGSYRGGFSAEQVEALLEAIHNDYDAWAAGFGALAMGQGGSPQAALEFVRVLRQLDPSVTALCFEAAFRGDYRSLMGRIGVPVQVVQSTNDPAVPLEAAHWLAAAIPQAHLQQLACEGHFPHVVDPQAVLEVIAPFLQGAVA